MPKFWDGDAEGWKSSQKLFFFEPIYGWSKIVFQLKVVCVFMYLYPICYQFLPTCRIWAILIDMEPSKWCLKLIQHDVIMRKLKNNWNFFFTVPVSRQDIEKKIRRVVAFHSLITIKCVFYSLKNEAKNREIFFHREIWIMNCIEKCKLPFIIRIIWVLTWAVLANNLNIHA